MEWVRQRECWLGDAAIMIHLEFFTHVTTTANLMGKHLTQRFPNIKSIKTIQRKREGRTLLLENFVTELVQTFVYRNAMFRIFCSERIIKQAN